MSANERDPKRPAEATDASREVADDRLLAFADRLRRPDEAEEKQEQPEVWVSFHLAGRLYALPVSHVREYAPVGKITRVPGAPEIVCGAASLRGHAIPVVDLKRILGLADGETEKKDHVLVAEQHGRLIGLLIDKIDKVLKVLPSRIQPTPANDGDHTPEKIFGFYELKDDTLILLAAETFLGQSEDLDR